MADNYLEKKMEDYRSRSQAVVRNKIPTLNQLFMRNRMKAILIRSGARRFHPLLLM